MHLARFPRRRYTEGWTPLEKMGRLSKLLGGPDLYIKRDDLLGLAAGGNKTEAARRLGISRKTLDRKCAAWGVH